MYSCLLSLVTIACVIPSVSLSSNLKSRKAVNESLLEQKSTGFAQIPLEKDAPADAAVADYITREMLTPSELKEPSLPYAKVRLLKGALNSFQAWQNQDPKCVGVILGRQMGANFDGLKIIASCDHSLTELVEHEKVRKLCEKENLLPCGLLLGEDKNRPEIQTLLEKMISSAPSAICVFVARHS